ncbi:hypothetical protein BJY04DRAFT_219656 [Aspergillus karnatakaensis]|uniref:uncharacterized protein n=1 Tax=Aspergillus karnatakaensis TaxID=1810916 RepID=UPI003CCDDA11
MSPDAQIRQWAVFNPTQKKKHNRQQRLLFKRDFSGALRDVLGNAAQPVLDYLQLSWEILTDTRVNDPPPYIGNVSARIAFVLDYFAVSPADDTPLESIDEHPSTLVIPWSLRGCGFNEENVLVWTFNFRKPRQLDTNELAMLAENRELIHSNSHRTMLDQCQAKIVFLCGPCAEKAIRSVLQTPERHILSLHGYDYPFYMDASAPEYDKRLHIRIPELPAEVWSINTLHAAKLGEILRFSISMLDLKSIRPYFLESSSVIGFILSQARRERLGGEPMTADTIDEDIRVWLLRKGIGDDKDIRTIETLGGTLTKGLLMVLRALPRRPREADWKPAPRGTKNTRKEVRCHEHLDSQGLNSMNKFVLTKSDKKEEEYTASLAQLHNEPMCAGEFPAVEEWGPAEETGGLNDEGWETLLSEDTIANRIGQTAVFLECFTKPEEQESSSTEAIRALLDDRQIKALSSAKGSMTASRIGNYLEKESLLEAEPADLGELVGSILTKELSDPDKVPPADDFALQVHRRQRKPTVCDIGISKKINHNTKGRIWRDETLVFRHKEYEFSVKGNVNKWREIRIGYCPIYFQPGTDIGDGSVWIKIDICEAGRIHPEAYAASSELEDPASRLAFRLRYRDSVGCDKSFYPKAPGERVVLRANTFVEILLSQKHVLDIQSQPRRFLYFPKGKATHGLTKFEGGVYTSTPCS